MTDYVVICDASLHKRDSAYRVKEKLNSYYVTAKTPEDAVLIAVDSEIGSRASLFEVWAVHDDDGRHHLIYCGIFTKVRAVERIDA